MIRINKENIFKVEAGNHVLIHGDCVTELDNIENNSIDLIFADPPYNIGKNFNGFIDKWNTEDEYLKWCYKWIDLCIDKLKSNGSFYVMTSTQFMPYFDIYIRKKIHILSRIIWYYDSSRVQAKKYYGSLYEPLLYCVKDKNNYVFNSKDILIDAKTGSERKLIDYRKQPPQMYNSKKTPGNIWYFSRVRFKMPEYEEHPSQKPIPLLERIIKASSNEGDIILDPFGGTFTTSFVAKQYNRQSISIELDKKYFEVGKRRLQSLN
jgi:adenine-specific DNA-methyltransferase